MYEIYIFLISSMNRSIESETTIHHNLLWGTNKILMNMCVLHDYNEKENVATLGSH